MSLEPARNQMLTQQIRAWDVLDERVLNAFRQTPRERFVPHTHAGLAFVDTEIPIGHGQCMMAPKVEGRLLQALDLRATDDVLEIGTGSGYLTACLARLARQVSSIDIFPEFVESAGKKLGEIGIANVKLETQDATTLSVESRFDAIAVTASVPAIDEKFVRMLKPGGRMFIVVGRAAPMEACLVGTKADGGSTRQSLFETVLTPMLNVARSEPFAL